MLLIYIYLFLLYYILYCILYYIINYIILSYIILFYSFITLYLSIRFNAIKIFRQNGLSNQMIDSLHLPLLEPEDWPLHDHPQECSLRPLKR